MFLDFLQDLGNYDDRVVANIQPEKNGGIGVDTAYTSDEGYETALLDANGVHPVERYTSKAKALAGHRKWVKKAKTIKKVTKLGWSGVIADEKITLKPYLSQTKGDRKWK